MTEDFTRNEVQVDLDKYQAMLRKIDELEDAAAAGEAPPPPKYQGMKDFATAVDSWRIFPRIFICTYIYLLYYSAMFLINLQNLCECASNEQGTHHTITKARSALR